MKVIKRNMKKIWGMKEVFIILIVVMLLQVWTCVKSHQTVYFKYVQFIMSTMPQ